MYANAPFWFAGLLVLALLGFWPSYFSPKASSATFAQHFHAVAMLIWVLLLIVQPWLIKARKRNLHRMVGRSSIIVAALVVVSALYVVYDNLAKLPQPYPPLGLSFFWLGLASAVYYGAFYSLAIINRRDMQLHARYMASTALVFIVPGLGRLLSQLGQATGLEWLDFEVALWISVLVGVVMVFHDVRGGRVKKPWILATVAWTGVILGFYLLPTFKWFSTIADWYLALG